MFISENKKYPEILKKCECGNYDWSVKQEITYTYDHQHTLLLKCRRCGTVVSQEYSMEELVNG